MQGSLKRNDTTPALANTSSNSAELLQRVFINERTLGEGWLQELIYTNPSVLPAGEVRADASQLIPIGREVAVESGRIDCLYVSPTGTLTLVEAKLWRNPEARREVVAQIIQYADELSRWTYEVALPRSCGSPALCVLDLSWVVRASRRPGRHSSMMLNVQSRDRARLPKFACRGGRRSSRHQRPHAWQVEGLPRLRDAKLKGAQLLPAPG